jgi:Transposase zinc-binding domain
MPIYLVLLVIRGCSFLDGLWQAPKPYSKRGTLYIACQTAARDRWIAARQKELLPTRYVHVVFTLPVSLARLALQNKKLIYGLLLRASAETLLEVARDPRHLGAEIGFFSVLHTCLLRACGPRNLMKMGSS